MVNIFLNPKPTNGYVAIPTCPSDTAWSVALSAKALAPFAISLFSSVLFLSASMFVERLFRRIMTSICLFSSCVNLSSSCRETTHKYGINLPKKKKYLYDTTRRTSEVTLLVPFRLSKVSFRALLAFSIAFSDRSKAVFVALAASFTTSARLLQNVKHFLRH